MTEPPAPLLLVADSRSLPEGERVWGTGGWLPPEEREALDWLTLARLCGWDVGVCGAAPESLGRAGVEGRRWVVVACEPEAIGRDAVDLIARWLASRPITVVVRAGHADLPMSGVAGARLSGEAVDGVDLTWSGASISPLRCRKPFGAQRIRQTADARTWLAVGGVPVLSARAVGRGRVLTLGFHPSAVRDDNGVATALLRRMLVESAPVPIPWQDLSGTMILRMDDPGAAQNAYLSSWAYPELDAARWREIGRVLAEREARLAVGYVSGWVDDGDPARGMLSVRGVPVERVPGRVHPSAEVAYRDRMGPLPGTFHDFVGEYRALRELQASGLVDLELHGHTHMHPDTAGWATAPDRYQAVGWYRELGPRALPFLSGLSPQRHPLRLGAEAVERYFGARPTTLICPGDEWTNEALGHALDLGLSLVSSYYLALRHDNRFCWTQHVCAPYLDEPDSAWFESGLPVVGYFHDREPSLEGPGWLAQCLDRWIDCGARRFITFRDLAVAQGC